MVEDDRGRYYFIVTGKGISLTSAIHPLLAQIAIWL
jgi:hypothetical protein